MGLIDTFPMRVLTGGRILIMPRAFPEEFHHDVVAIVSKGEAPTAQIPKDFGGLGQPFTAGRKSLAKKTV